jgi:hypothetical protein
VPDLSQTYIGGTEPPAAEEFGRDVLKLEVFDAFLGLGGSFFSGSSITGRILGGSLSVASDPQHRNLKGILLAQDREMDSSICVGRRLTHDAVESRES